MSTEGTNKNLRDTFYSKGASIFKVSRYEFEKLFFVYICIIPIVIAFFLLRVFPILQNFAYSFFRAKINSPFNQFVGFANFKELFHDTLFLVSLRNTTIFAFCVTIFSVAISISIASILETRSKVGALFETIYFIPVITPMVPVAIVWKWIYDPSFGLLNYFLSWFNIQPIGWLIYPNLAIWAIIVMSVWKVIGYNMVIFLVGIRDIPESLIEAARITGANGWQIFRYIIMPMLKPIILFVLVISTINSFNVFTQIYVMTSGPQGASGNAVRTLVFDIYENAFSFFKTGYAASEAVVLFLIVLVLTMIQLGIGSKDNKS